MSVIIGIDPGSRITGYGIISLQNQQVHYVHSGYIATAKESMPVRLQMIYEEIHQLIQQYRPSFAAIEKVFIHANPRSALILGQARGAAIAALASVPVGEYSARQVKLSVVGYGNADKQQVMHMIRLLLKRPELIKTDEADALAVAICHAHSSNIATPSLKWRSTRRGRVS